MKNADTLQELVSIARDGAEFYTDAGKAISDPSLKLVFLRMAEHKRGLIQSLGGRLAANQEDVPKDGTLVGQVRQLYADVSTSLGRDKASVYVTQLEETEDRLLDHFESALRSADDPGVKSLLQTHLPQVRACHDEMRALKQRMAA